MLTQADFYESIMSMKFALNELVNKVDSIDRELKELSTKVNTPAVPVAVEETVVGETGEVKKQTRKKKVTLNEEVKT